MAKAPGINFGSIFLKKVYKQLNFPLVESIEVALMPSLVLTIKIKSMKPIFLLSALFLTVCFSAHAQVTTPPTSAPVAADAIHRGNWMVGGSLGSTGFNFSSETYQLSLEPSAGYFISDRIALGAQAIIGLTAYDGGTNFNYGLAPFARYYFPEGASPSGRWFGEAKVGFAGSSYEGSMEDEPISVLLGIRGGYSHFIARNVALETSLGYTYSKADVNASSSTSGLGITLGFQIYLEGRSNR